MTTLSDHYAARAMVDADVLAAFNTATARIEQGIADGLYPDGLTVPLDMVQKVGRSVTRQLTPPLAPEETPPEDPA